MVLKVFTVISFLISFPRVGDVFSKHHVKGVTEGRFTYATSPYLCWLQSRRRFTNKY